MGAIFPTWLEKAEDLRYIGTGALEFDLDVDTLEFVNSSSNLTFDMQQAELAFSLEQNSIAFAPVHQAYEWQGNSSAVVFILTRVEI